ncbi:MAG: TIGR01777 family oxidoreductase [Bdellovibrionales bacterium]|nr:TIGR01777 family oxidoreductase [Bdellovibrionales bacterium]
MKIVVTGATGFLGESLSLMLLQAGHEVRILSRNTAKARTTLGLPVRYFAWKNFYEFPPVEAFEGADVIVHLMGESVADKRWTPEVKEEIYNSRIVSTANIIKLITKHNISLRAFIGGSAVGYYGNRNDEKLTESSKSGEDFLAKVCVDWENEVNKLPPAVRKVALRTGLVLGRGQGLMEKLEFPASFNLLGTIGNGQHYMSWIHVDDWVRAAFETITNEKLSGAFNLCAPEPKTNSELTNEFLSTINKWQGPPLPEFVVKIRFGEMSKALVASQRAYPQRLLEEGFKFLYPNLKMAFNNIYSLPINEKVFIQRQWFKSDKENVFRFFSDAHNLEKITPPFLNFKIKNLSNSKIQEGALIDYELKLHGLPIKWQTKILNWNPPHQFIDDQLKGPYARWYHQHSFEELCGGTLMEDKIYYKLPMAPLGQLIAGSFVLKDIKKIFSYRKKYLEENPPC